MTLNQMMTETFSAKLRPEDLVERWRKSITLSTLASWRCRGLGPRYVKVGGRVLYPLVEVEAYEKKNTRGTAA